MIMFQTAMKDGFQSLQKFSTDDVLAALGLQRRSSNFAAALAPSLAMFAAGAVVGAAAAVLLTPKTGPVLRRELSQGARDLSQRIGASASGVIQDVREALPTMATASDDDRTKLEASRSTGGANSNASRRSP
jgi:gas vesicle protein